ncbi:MAG: sulfopyruvate decarboxylase [Deltaproteobacteria bacterium]|nr:sulfopyruvate decarboxylase [Deltaproteobacteria bacterium]MBI3077538.1 sulfopyruvate decarboxylase [Deltaproteobacteria bacterium]
MKKACVDAVVAGLKEAGVTFISYLSDTWLKEVYERVTRDPHFRVVAATNEGEGVGICAGAWLSGLRSAMIMENSGLRVATEPLARLGLTHGIPVLLLMSFRGDLGDQNWWSQPHGLTMEPLLRALRIPYRVIRDPGEIRPAIVKAQRTLDATRYHAAVVFGEDLI